MAAPVRREKFFKILLPGKFDSTLCLPPKFAARLGCPPRGGGGAGAAATLRDPAGRSWDLQLCHCQNRRALCLAGTGWRSFVRANRLAAGHLLVFEHRGGLHFAVDLFDQSCCLKDNDGDGTVTAAAVDVESGTGGGGGVKRKRSPSPATSEDDTSGDGSCEEELLERKIERPYQLRFLDLSKRLCERVGWTSSRSAELRLKRAEDEEEVEEEAGRRWPVNVTVSGKGGMICGGWMAFAEDNHLRLNDTCVFFKPHAGHGQLIEVQLLRSTS